LKVKNLEDTIALAGNYVDAVNWDAMLNEMKGVIRGSPPHFSAEESVKLKMIEDAGYEPEEVDLEQQPQPYNEYKDQPGL